MKLICRNYTSSNFCVINLRSQTVYETSVDLQGFTKFEQLLQFPDQQPAGSFTVPRSRRPFCRNYTRRVNVRHNIHSVQLTATVGKLYRGRRNSGNGRKPDRTSPLCDVVLVDENVNKTCGLLRICSGNDGRINLNHP